MKTNLKNESAIQRCLDRLDEINAESDSVFDSDLYHDLCNAYIELNEYKSMEKAEQTIII